MWESPRIEPLPGEGHEWCHSVAMIGTRNDLGGESSVFFAAYEQRRQWRYYLRPKDIRDCTSIDSANQSHFRRRPKKGQITRL